VEVVDDVDFLSYDFVNRDVAVASAAPFDDDVLNSGDGGNGLAALVFGAELSRLGVEELDIVFGMVAPVLLGVPEPNLIEGGMCCAGYDDSQFAGASGHDSHRLRKCSLTSVWV